MRGERLELLVHKTENLSNNVRLLFTFLMLHIYFYIIFLRPQRFVTPAGIWHDLCFGKV